MESGQDVELEITPPNGGEGHIDVLTGITWVGSGGGYISLIDPVITVTETNGQVQADPFTVTISISANESWLSVSTVGAVDAEGQTLSYVTGGNITGYVYECVTPEPATIWLVILGMPLVLSRMRRRK